MNGTKRNVRHVVAMFTKHPCLFVCGLVVALAVGCTWYSCSGENIPLFPLQTPLFPGNSKVHEITDGSLDALSEFIDHSSLKFVMYYAPWCGQSKKAVPEFIKTANTLHQEVTFIAVNCWSGPCQKEYRLEYFPQLVAYHSTFSGITYPESSDVVSLYMVKFLQNILRPFSYIGGEHEIEEVKTTNQEVILSYINNTDNKEYRRFFGAALEYVGKVSRPFFGLVLNVNIAKKEGLETNGQLSFYKSLNTTSTYHPKSNSSIKNITEWISKNRNEIITELIPTPSKKDFLKSQLNEKPAVILFLPVRQHKIATPLLRTYTKIAKDYNNCTCINRKSPNVGTHALHNKVHHALPTLVNRDEIRPSSTHSPGHDHQMRTGISCYSFLVKNKFKQYSICESCNKACCHHRTDFKNILNHLQRSVPFITTSCWSLRLNPVIRASVCCDDAVTKSGHRERLKRDFRFTSDKVVQQKLDSFIDSFYNKVLKVLEPLQNEREMDKIDHEVSEATKGIVGRTVAPAVSTTTVNNSNVKENGSLATPDEDTSDGCNRTGHVTEFHGASCHSNRSVKFFYMDSERFWYVAQKLGVNGTTNNKVCLVVVDVKNEAYHVMSEDRPVTNQTIVEFVMEFMNSRLERTLRSAATANQACPKSQACVVEVTLATLNHVVMDDDKDVLLVYYAPWCGFCINLAPVLLTVARFFKDFKNVVIARIDADQNDLPWQHTVTSYPTIILYPARRKDFSVRFPDVSKRTAEALIQFILQHGTEATYNAFYGKADNCCGSDTMKTRLKQLESSLHRAEEEKHFLETRLQGIVTEKSNLELKNLKLLKGMHETQRITNEEKQSRITMETKIKEYEESIRETNDKNMILVLRNAQLETELSQLKGELHENREKSHSSLKEIQHVMELKEEMVEANELLIQKLDVAVDRISKLRKRDRLLSSKLRLLQSTRNTLTTRLTRTSIENLKNKKLIDDLITEKRTLISLLKDEATVIKGLKASLASLEERLGIEEEKRHTAIRKHEEANDKLKEMENNFEKLTLILSRIDIPKKQQVS